MTEPVVIEVILTFQPTTEGEWMDILNMLRRANPLTTDLDVHGSLPESWNPEEW